MIVSYYNILTRFAHEKEIRKSSPTSQNSKSFLELKNLLKDIPNNRNTCIKTLLKESYRARFTSINLFKEIPNNKNTYIKILKKKKVIEFDLHYQELKNSQKG